MANESQSRSELAEQEEPQTGYYVEYAYGEYVKNGTKKTEFSPNVRRYIGGLSKEEMDKVAAALKTAMDDRAAVSEQQDRWISCSERMPQEHQFVRIKAGKPIGDFECPAQFYDGDFEIRGPLLRTDWVLGKYVTHWQPIEGEQQATYDALCERPETSR